MLESTVLNFSAVGESPGIWENTGFALVNAVRLVSGKSALRIQEDQNDLRLLQYAFALERVKKVREASVLFDTVLPRLSGENRAFALLHSGYCRYLLGDDAAKKPLEKVLAESPGTHFAASARTLLALMNAQADPNESDADTAYRLGRYATSLNLYLGAKSLSLREKFRLARSMEETGRTLDAVGLYQTLADCPDEAVRRDSIRRLLILGTFLGAGRYVRDFAAERAAKTQDTAAEEIAEAEKLTKPTEVIGKKADASIDPVADLLAAASREVPAAAAADPEPLEEKTVPKTREPEKARTPPQIARKETPPLPAKRTEEAAKRMQPMAVKLKDGRTVSCDQIRVQGNEAQLIRSSARIPVKADEIEIVESVEGSLVINGSSVGARKVERRGDFFVLHGAARAYIPAASLREMRAE